MRGPRPVRERDRRGRMHRHRWRSAQPSRMPSPGSPRIAASCLRLSCCALPLSAPAPSGWADCRTGDLPVSAGKRWKPFHATGPAARTDQPWSRPARRGAQFARSAGPARNADGRNRIVARRSGAQSCTSVSAWPAPTGHWHAEADLPCSPRRTCMRPASRYDLDRPRAQPPLGAMQRAMGGCARPRTLA